MAKKVKELTASEKAYEIKKFLKRISIDFNFLEKILIWNNGGDLYISADINEFFKIKAKLFNEKTYLTEFLENKKAVELNFKNEDFIAVKNGLKKEFTGLEENAEQLKILMGEKNLVVNANLEIPTSELYNINGECITHPELDSTSQFSISKDGNKILELPVKDIVGYSGGNLAFYYESERDSNIGKCKLVYTTTFAEIELYFKIILN